MVNKPQIFWTYDGQTMTIEQWSAETGIPYHTLYQRREIQQMPLAKTLSARDLRRGPKRLVSAQSKTSSQRTAS